MENGLDIIKQFNTLSEADKQQILRDQAEKRIGKKEDVESLTNAEIARRDDFKTFCSKRGIEPTKRQVSKSREDFFEWKKLAEA